MTNRAISLPLSDSEKRTVREAAKRVTTHLAEEASAEAETLEEMAVEINFDPETGKAAEICASEGTEETVTEETAGEIIQAESDAADIHSEETVAEQEILFLPQSGDYLDMQRQYNRIAFFYESGIRQLTAKLEILNREFQNGYDRNPIEDIQSRIKSQESILQKMKKKGLPNTVSSMMSNIYDVAGVRVICPFISDVYQIAGMLLGQTDVELLRVKDYIKNPKENGYRSLHLIVLVNVFFSDKMRKVPVEIQLRTIAMNFWASLEHQLRYKKDRTFTPTMQKELFHCSELMAEADERMQGLANGTIAEKHYEQTPVASILDDIAEEAAAAWADLS